MGRGVSRCDGEMPAGGDGGLPVMVTVDTSSGYGETKECGYTTSVIQSACCTTELVYKESTMIRTIKRSKWMNERAKIYQVLDKAARTISLNDRKDGYAPSDDGLTVYIGGGVSVSVMLEAAATGDTSIPSYLGDVMYPYRYVSVNHDVTVR